MIEVTDNIFRVSNWEKYQNVEELEKIREQTRKRVAKHREKQRLLECNVTSNGNVTQGNATDKAFAVSIITQVFKGVSGLKKIPTDILVFVLSIGITVTAFVAYMQYIQQTIIWYMILAAIMAGFLVAFVAMYGWEKVSELWKRFYRGNTKK